MVIRANRLYSQARIPTLIEYYMVIVLQSRQYSAMCGVIECYIILLYFICYERKRTSKTKALLLLSSIIILIKEDDNVRIMLLGHNHNHRYTKTHTEEPHRSRQTGQDNHIQQTTTTTTTTTTTNKQTTQATQKKLSFRGEIARKTRDYYE